jgi:ABC-type multidrug transport system permease subunit
MTATRSGTIAALPETTAGLTIAQHANSSRTTSGARHMLFLLLGILVTIVIGAICFYLIDRFVRDGRLGNLLKLLVVLLCLISILQRLLPALGIGWL